MCVRSLSLTSVTGCGGNETDLLVGGVDGQCAGICIAESEDEFGRGGLSARRRIPFGAEDDAVVLAGGMLASSVIPMPEPGAKVGSRVDPSSLRRCCGFVAEARLSSLSSLLSSQLDSSKNGAMVVVFGLGVGWWLENYVMEETIQRDEGPPRHLGLPGRQGKHERHPAEKEAWRRRASRGTAPLPKQRKTPSVTTLSTRSLTGSHDPGHA